MSEQTITDKSVILVESQAPPKKKRRAPSTVFKKGDPRINRKGRPKAFDDMRRMAQAIAEEPMLDEHGRQLIDPSDNHVISRAEFLIRQWSMSRDSRLQIQFMEVCYGKVPQRNENVNIDIGTLTEEQLKLIAEGKSLDDVVGI